MIYVFAIHSPGSDMHGEPIEIQALDKATASERASQRVRETFALASAERKSCTTFWFVAEYPSRRAMEEATSWAAEQTRFRSLAVRQLARIGITDVERRIRFEKVVTPADWRTDFALHNGATFSMAHSLRQMLHLRPHNRFEDLDSVYLVGGGTHPGSGLPVIFESARITSRLLLEDLKIEPQWDVAPQMAEAALYEAAS